MKFGQLLALSVAVAASALAVTISSDYMASVKVPQIVQVAPPQVEMTKVVTAAAMIGHGRIIKPSDLKLMEWPANAVPDGAFNNVVDILGTEHGRMALARITPGEVITERRISGPNQRPSLALMLGRGMRAIAVRVNAVLGVGGFVLPGDRVDLLLTERGTDQEPGAIRSTEVLLRDVRVLAIDQQTEDPDYKPRVVSTVTIEVSLSDAKKVAHATTRGSISLALRGAIAPREPKPKPAERPAPVKVAPVAKTEDPMHRIVVFRSAKPTEYKVPKVRASLVQ